jgi:endonuclease G
LVPQTVKGNEPLGDFVTTIDEIEKQTSFDFFPNLDPQIQSKLEASSDPKEWNLEAVNKLPSRY